MSEIPFDDEDQTAMSGNVGADLVGDDLDAKDAFGEFQQVANVEPLNLSKSRFAREESINVLIASE